MQILLTGGTGFIGQKLVQQLLLNGDNLTVLTRQKNLQSTPKLKFVRSLAAFDDLNQFDAVINLAGEPIFAKRWSEAQKQKLVESRVSITRQLAELFLRSSNPPQVFLSGSATGFYGDLPATGQYYDESAASGKNFSTALCRAWENEAMRAQPKTRVCLLRTGLVLAPNGGALVQMLPLYRWNLAGKLGSGLQHWAWISLEDHIQAVIFLLKNANCSSAFNLVAPTPVTNQQFNHALAQALQRCAIFAAPTWGLKLAFGERSQILLDNQPLTPRKLLEAGFKFALPELDFQRILNIN